MNNESTKVNFDLSTLSLSDLIKVYDDINTFISFLKESKIEEKEEKDE